MSNIYRIIISWREPWHKFEDWDWFNARNFCRLGEIARLSWQSQWQWDDNDHDHDQDQDHDHDNSESGLFSTLISEDKILINKCKELDHHFSFKSSTRRWKLIAKFTKTNGWYMAILGKGAWTWSVLSRLKSTGTLQLWCTMVSYCFVFVAR